MVRTFEQWVAAFNKKVPEGFRRDERFTLFYLPDKGFCELMPTEKMMIVGNVSGNGRFWKEFAERVARKLGLKTCGTLCVRKAAVAYARLFSFKKIEVKEQDGLKRYCATDSSGNWGMMTEVATENNQRQYYVTWGWDNEVSL